MGRDHLYTPNGILKRFGYSDVLQCNEQIYKLDLLKNKIESIDTYDKFFTQQDFFDRDLDKEIQEKVESKVGELYKKITENENYDLDRKNDTIIGIFFIQYFRKSKYINQCGKKRYNEMMKSICNEFLKSNFKIEGECEVMHMYKKLNYIYDMYKPGYIKLKNTNRTFILPHNQFSYIFPNTNEQYIFPIAKEVALIWKKKTNSENEMKEFIFDDFFVEKINMAITMSEMQNNQSSIFYGDKEELSKIKTLYE